MTLSKEQIEDIQARAAVVSDKPWTVATPEDAAFIEAIAFPTIPALCQQALRAIELEAMFQFEGDDAAHMKPNDPALKDGIVVRRDHFDEMLKRQHSLQSELTATRKALKEEREIVKWLERKPAEVHCDFKCGYGKHGNKDECHCGFADWEASRPSPQVKP